MQEQRLLERVGQRDQAALRDLYLLYQPRLTRFLSRFTHSPQLIEEVVNDTLLVVWNASHRFRGDSSPSTWIMGIAYKKMLKGLKQSRRAFPAMVENTVPDYAEGDGMPDDPLDITRAVYALSDVHAAVVVLTYEFGYSYREIGEILRCPENTVKTRMFHARKALKKILESQS